MLKIFGRFIKFGIVIFVVISGLLGYFSGLVDPEHFQILNLLIFLLGLALFSGGSLALNQVQEAELDQKMPRTRKRPLPSGELSLRAALLISMSMLGLGTLFLFYVNLVVVSLGIATVVLYNFFYTRYWKLRWPLAAIPGAIPGAVPVLMGYAAHGTLLSLASLYLFLIMFLWQIPHFWILAIRYQKDYEAAGIPVLPAVVGVPRTLKHIAIYTAALVLLAFASPLFISSGWAYRILVLPMALWIAWECLGYYRRGGQGKWLQFFIVLNTGMLVFLLAPVVDRWVVW